MPATSTQEEISIRSSTTPTGDLPARKSVPRLANTATKVARDKPKPRSPKQTKFLNSTYTVRYSVDSIWKSDEIQVPDGNEVRLAVSLDCPQIEIPDFTKSDFRNFAIVLCASCIGPTGHGEQCHIDTSMLNSNTINTTSTIHALPYTNRGIGTLISDCTPNLFGNPRTPPPGAS